MSFDDIQHLVTLFSLFLVPVSHYLYSLLLSRMTAQRASQVQTLAGIVVRSVEQQMSGQPGPDKKQAAEDALDGLIQDFGLGKYVSPVLVNAVIEAAVQEMNAASVPSQLDGAESVPVPASVPSDPTSAL